MANNYTDILALVNAGNEMGLSNTIKRDFGIPLDYTSVQETYEAALAYAQTSTKAYVGQPISVGDTLYIVTGLEGDAALKAVGTKPTGDNKSIVVSDDGVVSMFGFEAASDATLPRKNADGSITWVTLADIAGSTDTNTKTVVNVAEDSALTVTSNTTGEIGHEVITYTLDVTLPAIPEYSVTKEAGEGVVNYKVTKDGTQVGETIVVPDAYDDSALIERLDALEDIDHSVYALDSELTDVEGRLDIIEGADTVEGSIAKALKDAKAYADGLAGNYDATGAAGQALTDAKAYTDEEIAGLAVAITDDNKIQIKDKAGELITEVDATRFVVDGMLADASFDSEKNELVFTWNTDAGKVEDRVPIAGLVDTYTAGNGLTLADHEFSVDTTVIATKASVEAAAAAAKTAQDDFDAYETAHASDYTNEQVDAKVSSAIDALKISEYAKSADVVSNTTFETFKNNNTAAIAKAVSDQATADDAKYATKTALNEVDAKFGNYTTTTDLNTLLGGKVSTEVLDGYYKKTETYSAAHIDELLEAVSGGSSETAASVKVQLDSYKETNDARVKAVEDKNTAQDTAITQNTNDIAAIKAADTGILAQAKSYTDGKITDLDTAYKSADTALNGRIDNVNALITGDNGINAKITALQNKDTSIDSEIAALKTTTDGHTTSIAGHTTKITALENRDTDLANLIQANTDKFDSYSTTEQMNTAIANAISGISYADLEADIAANTTAIADEVDRAKKAEEANAASIAILVGEDADKSVRTIAAEETAKIVASAPEAFDTLKEVADWISNDETGAAAMSAAIASNTGAIATLNGDGDGSVNKKIADAIAAIPGLAVATESTLGGVKASAEVAVAEDGTMSITSLSVDKLAQGTGELVLYGGNAGSTTAV